MKNHIELFETLLKGYTLVTDLGFECKLLNGFIHIRKNNNVWQKCEFYIPNYKSTKIKPKDFIYKRYEDSNSSQKFIGEYEETATKETIDAYLGGSFGGKFTYFEDGKFEYIAYTD